MLDDGIYDAFVVDADEDDDGAITVTLTVTTGPHKGDVVDVRAHGLADDALSLLGLPATIEVRGGRPAIRFD